MVCIVSLLSRGMQMTDITRSAPLLSKQPLSTIYPRPSPLVSRERPLFVRLVYLFVNIMTSDSVDCAESTGWRATSAIATFIPAHFV